MEKKYEEIGTYFCFDHKKVPMEEFFGDLSAFMKEFEVCGSLCMCLEPACMEPVYLEPVYVEPVYLEPVCVCLEPVCVLGTSVCVWNQCVCLEPVCV